MRPFASRGNERLLGNAGWGTFDAMDTAPLPPVSTPEVREDTTRRLDPRVVRLWRTTSLIWTIVLAGAALALHILWGDVFPFWIAGALFLARGLFVILYWARRRYEGWEFELRESDVRVRRGVLWRRTSVLPHARIQHVDTRHGPLMRSLGLASVVLYTAGHTGAAIEIPGLPLAEAESLRERLGALSGADDAV